MVAGPRPEPPAPHLSLVLPGPELTPAGLRGPDGRDPGWELARNDHRMGRASSLPAEAGFVEILGHQRLRITSSGRPEEYTLFRFRSRQIRRGP